MMTLSKNLVAIALAATIAVPTTLAPVTAMAQSKSEQSKQRQKTKNEWRNIGLASAAVGLYGFLKGDNLLGIIGGVGALYSADRYEKDRKSQAKIDRQRAALFSRSSFKQNGKTYYRHTKTKNGKKYYYFNTKR